MDFYLEIISFHEKLTVFIFGLMYLFIKFKFFGDIRNKNKWFEYYYKKSNKKVKRKRVRLLEYVFYEIALADYLQTIFYTIKICAMFTIGFEFSTQVANFIDNEIIDQIFGTLFEVW